MTELFYAAKRPGIPGFSAIHVLDDKKYCEEFRKEYTKKGYLVSKVDRETLMKGWKEFVEWRKNAEEEETLFKKISEKEPK